MDLREPKKKKRHWVRNSLVVVGAIIVTSIAVNATDNLGSLRDSALGSAVSSVLPEASVCEDGMVLVSAPLGDFCIDMYEVSAGEDCDYINPRSALDTQANLNNPKCTPQSVEGKEPWTHVSHTQAVEACAKAGKHLPSNQEWFLASLGTPDTKTVWTNADCNVDNNWGDNNPGRTGSGSSCRSTWGAHDMIGNVWEWTFETVSNGNYKGRELPDGGYVNGVNEEGVPTASLDTPNSLYFLDRFWIDKEASTGIFRGGFWNNGSDAGRFAFHSEIPTSFTGSAVGFRCAK